jgi:hypothetical protein
VIANGVSPMRAQSVTGIPSVPGLATASMLHDLSDGRALLLFL